MGRVTQQINDETKLCKNQKSAVIIKSIAQKKLESIKERCEEIKNFYNVKKFFKHKRIHPISWKDSAKEFLSFSNVTASIFAFSIIGICSVKIYQKLMSKN